MTVKFKSTHTHTGQLFLLFCFALPHTSSPASLHPRGSHHAFPAAAWIISRWVLHPWPLLPRQPPAAGNSVNKSSGMGTVSGC